jgi:O-antigen ligase
MENTSLRLSTSNIPSEKKYILLFLPFIFILSAFGFIGWQAVVAVVIYFLFYFFARQWAWVLVVLAPLGLLLGTIFNIEIRPNWFYDISAGEIFIAFAFLTLILDLFFSVPKKKSYITSTGWWLILYTILAACSIFYVRDYELFVAGLKVQVFSIMAYLCATNLLDTKKKMKAFIISLIVFTGVLACQIFYIFSKSGFSTAIFYDRSSITFPFGPLALVVAILAFLLPLIFSTQFAFPRFKKISHLSLIVFIFGFIAVFMSLGKAAALSLVMGLIYLFWRFKERRIIMTLSLLFFIGVGILVFSPYTEGFAQRFTQFSVDTSTTFRIEEYKVVRRIISDHPWLGLGIGEQLRQYQRLLYPDYRQLANNYFFQVGMDLGFIGISIYLCLFISIIILIIKLNRTQPSALTWGVTGAAIAASVGGLFEVTLFAFQYAIIFWLVIGMTRRLYIQKDII